MDLFFNCMFIHTCLNFSHLQSTLHLMQYTYRDFCPPAKNNFWTHQIWCLLVLPPFSVSPLAHQQIFAFEDFFTQENKHQQPKNCSGRDQVNREGETWGSWHFWQDCRTLRAVWVGALVNHSSWNRQTHWKNLKKKSLKPNTASHNNARWYTDTDGSLEHSAGKGTYITRGPSSRR